MGLCFIVLAHTAPEQVGRLISTLTEPGSSVILHVDSHVDDAPFRRAAGRPAGGEVRFNPRRFHSGWGQYGLVDATVTSLELALEAFDFSHVILLSGLDYPITSAHAREEFFLAAGDKSYVSWSGGEPGAEVDRSRNERWYWNGDMHRLRTRYYWVAGRSIPMPNKWLPFIPAARPPKGLTPYQGSQWWNLHRTAAEYCVRYLRENPKLVRFFRHTLIPDEFVFQMALLNSSLGDSVVNEDLRFMSWVVDHPKLLGPSDLDTVFLPSKKLFARKFDERETPGILDLLDQRIAQPGVG